MPGKADQSSTDKAQSDYLPAPRRSSRRRSVRFEDGRTPDLESKESENSICASDKLPGISSASHKTASLDVENRIGSSKGSSEDSSQRCGEQGKSPNQPWPEPNVMAGGSEKLIDTLSSKDTSLSVISVSSGSSGEEKRAKSVEESDPFFRPFKSLSQTLPRTASIGSEKTVVPGSEGSVRLMTRKTRSQEITVSATPTAGRDKELAGKSSSPPGMFTCLDRWLKKSPSTDNSEEAKTVSQSPKEANKLLKETGAHEKVSPPRSSTALVEETQSPTQHAGEVVAAHLSIQETPPKPSSSSSPAERSVASVFILSTALKGAADAEKERATDKLSEVALKQPVLQLTRLSEKDLVNTSHALPPLIPAQADADEFAENEEFNLEPPVLCNHMASQGFSPELQNCSPPRLGSSELGSVRENEVMVVEDSMPHAHENSTCRDHQTLFGFSELLQMEHEPSGSDSKHLEGKNEAAGMEVSENLRTNMEANETNDAPGTEASENLLTKTEANETNEAAGMEVSENLLTNTEASETNEAASTEASENLLTSTEANETNEAASTEASENLLTNTETAESQDYNPHLTATLPLKPLKHCSVAFSPASETSDSSGSQEQHSSSNNMEVTPTSSQRSQLSDSEVSFDPAREATLGERTVRAKKRKQLMPKKIADPQLLRRTSRKKTERKPVCDCCKGGPNDHHQNSPHDSRKQRRRQHSKGSPPQSPPTVKSPVRKRARRSLNGGTSSSPTQEQGSEVPGCDSEIKLTGEIEEGAGNKLKDLSPQDIGEKTPEMKTNSTPLRHSTTKRKMEAARLRSMSLPLRTSLDDVTKSNLDLDNVPLSQLAADLDNLPLSRLAVSMKLQRAEVDVCDSVEKQAKNRPDKDVVCAKMKKSRPRRKMAEDVCADASPKGGMSRLKLKKRARQKKDTLIRSPPKLRLRQRSSDKISGQDKSESVTLEQPGGIGVMSSPPPVHNNVKETDPVDRLAADPDPDSDVVIADPSVTAGEQMMRRSGKKGKKETKQKTSSAVSSAQPGSSSASSIREASVSQSRPPVRFHCGRMVYRRIRGRRRQRVVFINFDRRRGCPRVKSAPAKAVSENASEEVEIEQYESHQLSLDSASQTKTDAESVDQAPQSADLSASADATSVPSDTHATVHQVLSAEVTADMKAVSREDAEVGVDCLPDTGDVNSSWAVVADADCVTAMETGVDGSEDMFEDSPAEEGTSQTSDPKVSTVEEEHLGKPAEGSLQNSIAETTSQGKEDLDKQSDTAADEKEVVTGSKSASQEVQSTSDNTDTKLCSGGAAGDELPGFLHQLNVQDEHEQMTAEDLFTEDSAVHVFPHNQAGLEQEEEELSPAAIFENSVAEKGVEGPRGRNGFDEVGTVLRKDNAVGDTQLSTQETAVPGEDAGAAEADQSAEKHHTAIQTSPESQGRRKLSKEEILNIIAESDVSPAEIIVALQTKTSKARRLFASSPPKPDRRFKRLPYTLPGRGMKMVERSILMQKQQQFGGYPTKSMGSQLDVEDESSPGARISVLSSPTTSPSGSILKRRGTPVSQEAEIPEDPSQTPTPIKVSCMLALCV